MVVPVSVVNGVFQFLRRNSVRWDAFRESLFDPKADVSIPQSEFCPLGPHYEAVEDWQGVGFNSSVGILSVGTYAVRSSA